MLTAKENKLINLLIITSILIFIQIGPVSISFPIGVFFLYKLRRRVKFAIWNSHIRWLSLLFVVGVFSTIFSPLPIQGRNFYFLLQLVYWLLLATFVGQLYLYIDKNSFSKSIVLGCLILGAVNLLGGLGTQNSVAFILVVIAPIGICAFKTNIAKLFYAFLIFVMMLFNESRSGLAILSIELLVIISRMLSTRNAKLILWSVLIFVGIFIGNSQFRKIVGNIIAPYNSEMSLLLIDPESILSNDKSWIQRQVQVQKGIQIFQEYPLIGIGANNFTPMTVDINYNAISNRVDKNALVSVSKSADNRSTHNSYITLLSEYGILGTICWFVFIFTFMKRVYKKLRNLDEFDFILFITSLGLSVYFYTIAALYGTAVWIVYGLYYGCARKYQVKCKLEK